jgi:hypothetical protein
MHAYFSYLTSPDYAVSVNAVQPEARQEMDETWDYDYEESKGFVGGSSAAAAAMGYLEVRTHPKVKDISL